MNGLQAFTIKAYEETIQNFKNLKEESGTPTVGKFLELLLENFQNPRPANPAELKRVQELEEEVSKLNFKINEQNAQIYELINREPVQKLVEVAVEKPIELKENEIILQLDPVINHYLTELATIESSRTSREVSRPMILLNLFWSQITTGPGNYLPKIYTRAEIMKKVEQLKQAAE